MVPSMSGTLTRQFSRKSSATLFLNRSTPVSAFEENAYYVFTAIQGSGRLPRPRGRSGRVTAAGIS